MFNYDIKPVPSKDPLVSIADLKVTEVAEIRKCCTIKENGFAEAMQRGQLRFGQSYPDSEWKRLYDILKSIPDTMQQKQEKAHELQRTITQKNAESKEIERQIQTLQRQQCELSQQLKDHEANLQSTNETLQTWHEVRAQKYSDLVRSVHTAAEIEEIQASSLVELAKKNPSALAALTDTQSEYPKLSLLFNMAGLTDETISKLADVSGEEFSSPSNFLPSIPYFELEFQQHKDLEYCHAMVSSGHFPYTEHSKDCVVCCCDTPVKLFYLLEKHSAVIDVTHFTKDFLQVNFLNGPRTLLLTRNDLKQKTNVKPTQLNSMVKVVLYLTQLHTSTIN